MLNKDPKCTSFSFSLEKHLYFKSTFTFMKNLLFAMPGDDFHNPNIVTVNDHFPTFK